MSKRKWTDIKKFEAEIIAMREVGKTRREIAEHLDLKKEQIKDWGKRYDCEQARLAAGLPSKRHGRPPKGEAASAEEYKRKIEQALYSRYTNTRTYRTGSFSQTGPIPNGLQTFPIFKPKKVYCIFP